MFTNHFQGGHFYGKGISAADRFERDTHKMLINRDKRLDRIDTRELKEIVAKVHAEFGDAPSFTERDFYTKVLKSLSKNLYDRVSASEAKEVGDAIGMGSSYKGRQANAQLDHLAKHDGTTDDRDYDGLKHDK